VNRRLKLKSSTSSFLQYSIFTTENTTNFPDLGDSPYPSAPPIRATEQGVVKLLLDLNPHKASGPDTLCTWFLKEMLATVAPSFNTCIPGHARWRTSLGRLEEGKCGSNLSEGGIAARLPTTDMSPSPQFAKNWWNASSTWWPQKSSQIFRIVFVKIDPAKHS
jgi:hypothetical protein